eukprot:scaffold35968_cov55-Cyclotella_meneghiniana.AAC.5
MAKGIDPMVLAKIQNKTHLEGKVKRFGGVASFSSSLPPARLRLFLLLFLVGFQKCGGETMTSVRHSTYYGVWFNG